MERYPFPGHFKVKDAKDVIADIVGRIGLRSPDGKYSSEEESAVDDIVLPRCRGRCSDAAALALFMQRPLAAPQWLLKILKDGMKEWIRVQKSEWNKNYENDENLRNIVCYKCVNNQG